MLEELRLFQCLERAGTTPGWAWAKASMRGWRCANGHAHAGHDRYPITGDVEAIGLTDIMATLAALE